MIKLVKAKYSICKRLKTFNFKFPEAYSIITGITRGEVFIDDILHPKIGIIYSYSKNEFYLIGNLSDKDYFGSIKNKIAFSLSQFAKDEKISELKISAPCSIGDSRIEELFSGGKFKVNFRLLYEKCYLEKRKIDFEEVCIKCVSSISDIEYYDNSNFAIDKLVEYWGDVDVFEEFGKCAVLVVNNNIAFMVLTTTFYKSKSEVRLFKSNKIIDINADTQVQNELIYKLAYKFIRSIRKDGIVPYLDCLENDLDMIEFAESLGFIHTSSYKNYIQKC